jgi:hypothetical protein
MSTSRKRRPTTPEDGATPFEVAHADLRRDAAQMRRLGTDEPMCVICGETDPDQLTTGARTLLEDDHLAGRHEGPTVVLCLNHHAKRTAQGQHGPQRFLAADRTELERIGALLDHRAGYFEDMARIDRALARYFLELTKRVAHEAYRDIPCPFVTRKDSQNE